MTEAAAAEEYERAAIYRDRLEAVRSLMQRRSVAGEALDSADLIAVAVEGSGANAQVFQVRDGILAERHGFYLANEGERGEAEVTEEFVAQYYSAVPAVPRLVVVGPALRDRGRPPGRGPVGAARRVGRGAGGRARRQAPPARAGRAQRPARPRPGQAALGAPPLSRGSTPSRPSRRRSTSTRCRFGSRGSTSRTSAPITPSPRWSCSRGARRRSPTTASSRSAASALGGRMTSLRWRRSSAGARPACSSRRIARRTTSATRASPPCRT